MRLLRLQYQQLLNSFILMLRKLGLTIASLLLAVLPAFGEVEIPAYENYITDISERLSDSVEVDLNERLAAYETETGSEIAVLILPLIPTGLTANEYATKVGNSWGVGKAGAENGALLLIETDDVPGQRDVYIATGSQLEGGLADLEATDIIDYLIIPEFQSGDFDAGVRAGVEGIIAGLEGEVFVGGTSTEAGAGIVADLFQYGFMFIFFVLPWFGAIFGRSKEIWPGGAVGAASGGLLGWLGQLGLNGMIGATIALGLFGVLLDWLVSRNYQQAKKSGKKASWWAGGNSGSGSSSGGGFGGFGGGGFSGGGGGGRW